MTALFWIWIGGVASNVLRDVAAGDDSDLLAFLIFDLFWPVTLPIALWQAGKP